MCEATSAGVMLWSCAVPVLGAPFLAIWTQLSQFQQQIYVFPSERNSHSSNNRYMYSHPDVRVQCQKKTIWALHNSFNVSNSLQIKHPFQINHFFPSTQLPSPTLKKIVGFAGFIVLNSPWYNHTGWLGVKHQVTYYCSQNTDSCLKTSEELMPATSKQTLPTSSTPHHLLLFRAHSTQQRRVRCLQLGAVSKSSQTNISLSRSAATFVTVTRAFFLGLHTLLGKTTVCGKLNQSLSANQSGRPSSCIWGDS